jgi:CheY-like chemotaxis protein
MRPDYSMENELPPLRVLVVEDDAHAAFALEMLLNYEGVAARVAHDGEMALQIVEQWQPQIVLLDIGLPRISGYQVAEAIRATALGPGMLLVAITGWGADADKDRARSAGFDEHWTKPLEPWRLIALLARYREVVPFSPPQGGSQHV